jgi:hypothetical protein
MLSDHHVKTLARALGDIAREVHFVHKAISAGGHNSRTPSVRFSFGFGVPQSKTESSIMPVSVSLTNEQKVSVKLTPVTDTGKPAKLDGLPSWAVIDGNSQVVVAEDGYSATLISSDDPGTTNILVKADADLGAGVEEISDTIQVVVVGATARNLGISVGTPEAK